MPLPVFVALSRIKRTDTMPAEDRGGNKLVKWDRNYAMQVRKWRTQIGIQVV